MAIKHLDAVKFATSSTGTGDVTVGAASGANSMTPVQAGGVPGDSGNYLIEEGTDFEIGRFVLNNPATSMTRSVIRSRISGAFSTSAKMSLLGAALVRFVQAGEDILVGPSSAVTDGGMALWDGTDGRHLKNGAVPGTAAAANLGTSGDAVGKLNTKNAWSAPQRIPETSVATATAWDGSVIQRLGIAVNGAAFAIANPSVVPDAGTHVTVNITYTTSHAVTFGNLFRGFTGVTLTQTAGKKDYLVFKSDGTNLELVGYRLDYAT